MSVEEFKTVMEIMNLSDLETKFNDELFYNWNGINIKFYNNKEAIIYDLPLEFYETIKSKISYSIVLSKPNKTISIKTKEDLLTLLTELYDYWYRKINNYPNYFSIKVSQQKELQKEVNKSLKIKEKTRI